MKIAAYKSPFGEGEFYEVQQELRLDDLEAPQWGAPFFTHMSGRNGGPVVSIGSVAEVKADIFDALPTPVRDALDERSRQETANGVPPYMEVRMHCKENVSLRGIRKDRQNARIEEAKARLGRDVQEFHGRVMADELTRINGKLGRILEMLNYDESEVVKGLACAGGAISGYLDTQGIGNSQRDKMEAISANIARLRDQQSTLESELQGLRKARVLAMLTHHADNPGQVLMKQFPKDVAEGLLELFGPNGKAFKIERGFF